MLDTGGFSSLVPVDEKRRARLRVLRRRFRDLAMPCAVLAEGLLTDHPGYDYHARRLLDIVQVGAIDEDLGYAAGRLRTSVRAEGFDPVPSGVDALVVAFADLLATTDEVVIVSTDRIAIEALAVFALHADRLAVRCV